MQKASLDDKKVIREKKKVLLTLHHWQLYGYHFKLSFLFVAINTIQNIR